MYEEHATFVQPENDKIKVWRYMDFTKLVSLLDSRRLYFTRSDKFDDPFEGSWTKINILARGFIPKHVPPERHDKFIEEMTKLSESNPHWRRFNAVNCWHMNEYESAAMWRLYLKSDEGIAIQSTYTKLKKSLIDDERIFLGLVKYIDYETDYIDPSNILSPFVCKRKSFEHEREIRAVITKLPIKDTNLDLTHESIEHGLKIKVDLETLIERIYVAPSAPEWFADLIKAVINRYGYNFNVVHSRLNENPVF